MYVRARVSDIADGFGDVVDFVGDFGCFFVTKVYSSVDG